MRFIFIILFVLSYQFSTAQTFVRSFRDLPYAQIPKDLTQEGHQYVYQLDNYTTPLRIFNEKYEIVREIDFSTLTLPIYSYYLKKETKDNYSGTWIIDSEENSERPFLLNYTYDNNEGQTIATFFSQTLFSDDEKFEFYVPTGIEKNRIVKERGNKRETSESCFYSGVNVISEDGNVLATFKAEGFLFKDDIITIRKVGNTFYFTFSTNDENNPYALYKVEKKESDTNNPSLARKEGDLTGDGKVDVADHVKLSEIIMNQK